MTEPTTDPNADLEREADAALAGADPLELDQGGPAVDDATAAAIDAEQDAAALSSLLKVTFNQALAPRLGAHWSLADSEADSLGGAYSAVLNKYFPNWRTGPELTALVVSLAVFGPRIATTVAQQRKDAQESARPPVDAGTDAA